MNATETLARTLWGEARGEGQDGMHAVANVVMNRVASPCWWGDDVISVCTKPWQFSCWNANDPNRAKMLAVKDSDRQYNLAWTLAAYAVSNGLEDLTNGATSYYAASMKKPPKWASDMLHCATIGNHIFLKAKPVTKTTHPPTKE